MGNICQHIGAQIVSLLQVGGIQQVMLEVRIARTDPSSRARKVEIE